MAECLRRLVFEVSSARMANVDTTASRSSFVGRPSDFVGGAGVAGPSFNRPHGGYPKFGRLKVAPTGTTQGRGKAAGCPEA